MAEFFDNMEFRLREKCIKRVEAGKYNFSADPGEENDAFEEEASWLISELLIDQRWLHREFNKLSPQEMATVLEEHANEHTRSKLVSLAIEAMQDVLGENGLIEELADMMKARWENENRPGFKL